MVVLRKIGVMSVARVYAVIMAIFGLVVGLFAALFLVPIGMMMEEFVPFAAGMSAGLGLLSIVVFPIMYGIMGFVMGAVCAWIYNIVASKIGGIELTIK